MRGTNRKGANTTFPAPFNSMKHIFFLFSITTVAFAATRRCPRIPSTHCASLHNDVTCSGWSHKVRNERCLPKAVFPRPGPPRPRSQSLSSYIAIKVRNGATWLPHSHRNKAGAVVARKWCVVEGIRIE